MKIDEKIIEILGENIAFTITGPLNLSYKEEKAVNPASIIKLSVLYGLLKKLDEGKITLSQSVDYTSDDIVPGSGVLKNLSLRKACVMDLATLMITSSDNTATNILIDFIGIDYIQKAITNLGLTHTHLRRKLYRMVPGVFNVSTTKDTNRLLTEFDCGQLSKNAKSVAMDILSKQQLKNFDTGLHVCGHCQEIFFGNYCRCKTFVGDIDPLTLEIYSKSGEISGHVHDAAIIKYHGQTLYISLFTYNQTDNLKTKRNFPLIGKFLLDYLKEQSC